MGRWGSGHHVGSVALNLAAFPFWGLSAGRHTLEMCAWLGNALSHYVEAIQSFGGANFEFVYYF